MREQKQRLQERSKTTENLTQQNKQLTTKFERAIDELKKIREQIVVLQKERREIDARLVAQESILSGLREEKKLWSHELAHQGFHSIFFLVVCFLEKTVCSRCVSRSRSWSIRINDSYVNQRSEYVEKTIR